MNKLLDLPSIDVENTNRRRLKTLEVYPRSGKYMEGWPCVVIYTDGSCVKNPGGPGGWGASLCLVSKKGEGSKNKNTKSLYKEIKGGVVVCNGSISVEDRRERGIPVTYEDLLVKDMFLGDKEDENSYLSTMSTKYLYAINYDTVTNNRMEMLAVVQALRSLKRNCNVMLHSDSQYVLKCMSVSNRKWARTDWTIKNENKTKGMSNSVYEYVKNHDLWRELYRLSERHKIQYHWVRGHNGHEENENADTLASRGRIEAEDAHRMLLYPHDSASQKNPNQANP